jgi:hypothetical protein
MMGAVICLSCTYWQFIRRDKKHIVGLVVRTFSDDLMLANVSVLGCSIHNDSDGDVSRSSNRQ